MRSLSHSVPTVWSQRSLHISGVQALAPYPDAYVFSAEHTSHKKLFFFLGVQGILGTDGEGKCVCACACTRTQVYVVGWGMVKDLEFNIKSAMENG